MSFYLVRQLKNTAGQDGSSIAVYDTEDAAYVAYHNTCASYRNAKDVMYSVVQILNDVGNSLIKEILDRRPLPEPEPEEAEEPEQPEEPET